MEEKEQVKIIQKIQEDKYYFNFSYIVGIDDVDENYVYSFIESGGSDGASCWDDSPSVSYSIDFTPGIPHLDEILQAISPNISFLKFREIEKSFETDEFFDSDWYGNGTNYNIYYISIDKLLEIVNA